MNTPPTSPGDSAPLYNVKAAAARVGVPAVTLRAWERRYGVPAPSRSAHGYRTYSEQDVRTLRWLKAQTETGLSIGLAVRRLAHLRAAGQDPALAPPAAPADLSRRLRAALAALDERTAADCLRLAGALYPLDRMLLDVIRPALIALGEDWHTGRLPVAAEHFATQVVLRHMMSLYAAAGAASRPGVILAACAPGELHEIGLLMVALMLRWRGWDVLYLGPNLSLERLAEAVAPLKPRLLLFTANQPETAAALQALPAALEKFPQPRPRVILGGQAFAAGAEALGLPGQVLSGEPDILTETIERLLIE